VSGNPIKIRRVLHYATDWTSVEDTLLSAVQGVESPSPDPRVKPWLQGSSSAL